MSREEEIAKIDAELEKIGEGVQEDDVEEAEEDEDTDSEDVSDEEQPDDKAEEPKKEEEKPPVKLEIKDLPEGAGWYKAREEARKREAAERELAELKKPRISKDENYEGYVESEIAATKQELAELREWKQKQEEERLENEQKEGAFRELAGYEAEASQAYPDYSDASKYAKAMIAASIKVLEPGISQEALAEKTIMAYARQAAVALGAKKHPGQAIYELAHEMGYKKAEPRIEVKQDNRPTIQKIGENKKKSAGMSNGGGNGKAFITNDSLSTMTNAERMKLTPSDWERLERESA